ncbi:MAG: hypothetical protein OIF35_02105, partial [Cellvibrionaceae bacterium]|nr:hypothetical protein [Cellvibrionaceae bacterium]
MKSIELLSTGIRLLGIYTLIYALRTSVSQFQLLPQYKSGAVGIEQYMAMYIYTALGVLALLLLAAFVMIKFPRALASWILPKTKESDIDFNGSSRDVEISVFTIIGVYMLTWAIPDLLYNGLWLWQLGNSAMGDLWGPDQPNKEKL